MKNALNLSRKFVYKNVLKRSFFFKYNLKYKGIIKRLNFFCRNRKFFGIRKIFFGVLSYTAVLKKTSFFVYKIVFLKNNFLDKLFSSKIFLSYMKSSLKSKFEANFFFKDSVSRSFKDIFCFNKVFLDLFNKSFFVYERKIFFFKSNFVNVYSFVTNLNLYNKDFGGGVFKYFFIRFTKFIKTNFSLLTNFNFDFVNSIVSDNKSFLLLNPVLLNNIISL